MPKLFNTSLIAVLIATLVFFAIGAVWYGPLFEAQWLNAAGMTQEQAQAHMTQMGIPIWLFWALLITAAQAIGVLMVIHKNGAKRMKACLETTFWVLITLVGPVLAYTSIYQGLSLTGFLIDFGHLFIGYMTCAAIYALFRGKDAIDA